MATTSDSGINDQLLLTSHCGNYPGSTISYQNGPSTGYVVHLAGEAGPGGSNSIYSKNIASSGGNGSMDYKMVNDGANTTYYYLGSAIGSAQLALGNVSCTKFSTNMNGYSGFSASTTTNARLFDIANDGSSVDWGSVTKLGSPSSDANYQSSFAPSPTAFSWYYTP